MRRRVEEVAASQSSITDAFAAVRAACNRDMTMFKQTLADMNAGVVAAVARLSKDVMSARGEAEEHLLRYKREAATRKALHNRLIEMAGNIRVFVRVRPMLAHEAEADALERENKSPALAAQQ